MKKIFQLLFSVCLFLLILELGTRAVLLIKPVYRTVCRTFCDATFRWTWLERHNKQGTLIYYKFDRYDPTKGWALVPNISNMPCFNGKFINTNSKGIRGKVEYQYTKDKDKLRILFIGDSFTFGEEVSDNETYPYYLQQLLPDTEIINMGVHGYGQDQMLIYLKEEGIKYKPDIIILGFLMGDMQRNMLEFRDYAKPRFKLINNGLKLYNSPVPPPELTLKMEPWRSKFIDLLKILKWEIFLRDGSYDKEEKELTNAILKDIAITAKGVGAVPVFAYLTSVRSEDRNPGMTREESSFNDTCKNISVDCVFFRQQILLARQSGVKIKAGGHFGVETNRLVALGLKAYLQKNDLLEKK